MFQAARISTDDPHTLYAELAQQLEGLLAGERDAIANAANMAALIFTSLPDLNWAGFYFLRGDTLVLGPFQGKPGLRAHRDGQRRLRHRSRKAADVAGGRCRCLSRPHRLRFRLAVRTGGAADPGGAVIGVLDIDSPIPSRFDAIDQAGIERLAAIFVAGSDAP